MIRVALLIYFGVLTVAGGVFFSAGIRESDAFLITTGLLLATVCYFAGATTAMLIAFHLKEPQP